MSFRVIVMEEAQRQMDAVAQWWMENRGEAELLDREVTQAFALLSQHPEAGPPYQRARFLGIRKLLLRRSQYLFYYRVERAREEVLILAFWHTARRRGPPL